MIFLMRMTMFPFSMMSYLLGVTSVTFKNYLVGTLSVCLHVVLWLYIGSTLSMFDEDNPKKPGHTNFERAVIAGQVILAISLGFYIGIIAKREFEKSIRLVQDHCSSDPESLPLKRVKL